MTLVLSTSWNASCYNHAKEIAQEIKDLGFKKIELNFSLPKKIVEEFISLVRNKEICVTSVHNFCPIPDEVTSKKALPDYYSLASLDEKKRKLAVNQTKLTIKTAYRLKVKAVVLHSGRVEIKDKTRVLIELYEKGLKNTKRFKALQNSFINARKIKAKKHLSCLFKSLETLNQYASNFGIKIGIENRFYFREIPSFKEIGIILDKFKGSHIFYWHDVGHAQVMENLGFAKHKDFLDSYSNRMIGIHLHDLQGCSDHRAPLDGEFNFKTLLPYIKKNTLKVIEAHQPATKDKIKKAKIFLEKLFDDRAN